MRREMVRVEDVEGTPSWVAMHTCNCFLGSLEEEIAGVQSAGTGRPLGLVRTLRRMVSGMVEAGFIDMGEGEPLAREVAAADRVSFNLSFPPEMAVGEGRAKWGALWKPVPYVALIRKTMGGGGWLCEVSGSEGEVSVRLLKSGLDVPVPPGSVVRWTGRNIRIRLGSGAHSFVALMMY